MEELGSFIYCLRIFKRRGIKGYRIGLLRRNVYIGKKEPVIRYKRNEVVLYKQETLNNVSIERAFSIDEIDKRLSQGCLLLTHSKISGVPRSFIKDISFRL